MHSPNTSFVCNGCSSSDLEKMKLSSMYIMADPHFTNAKMTSTALWNVAGASYSLYGVSVYRSNLCRVAEAVLSTSLSSISVFW